MVGNKEIDKYIRDVESGKLVSSNDIKLLCKHVKNCFENESIYVDKEQFNSYMAIGKAMYKDVLPWESFLLALMLCTYHKNGKPRWNRTLVMIGRGAGKDGFIAWIALCLISKSNPVKHYDVDICANNEEQALRPVQDAVEFLNRAEYSDKNKISFYWTSERIKGLRNLGVVKGHTNSPKGKDGLRSGCVILNEIHQYDNYANVNVFTTGLGKKEQPRSIYFTTNGDVRGGVLDHYLEVSKQVLNNEISDDGFLPFLCRLDSKDEVNDEKNWVKANPSLPYFPQLFDEIKGEYKQWKENPQILPAFMGKRMNLPDTISDQSVCDYEFISATNKEVPKMNGKSCIVGVDMSRTTDFASVSALFREGENRYVINHTWICTKSKDLPRIRIRSEFPTWVEKGIVTMITEPEISPRIIAEYIQSLKKTYVIQKVAYDDFRQSLFGYELKNIGFSNENKNVKSVRPSDIAKAVPVIERCFLNGFFYWGDNPMLRWCTNNTKVVSWKPRTVNGNDLGNQLYAKIEPKSRKTDAFMSLVHAMTVEDEIVQVKTVNTELFRAKAV